MPTRPAARVKSKRAGAVVLAADCCLQQITELKTALLSALPRAAPVELDASAVKQIDAAGLQLLAAFVRERQLQGRVTVWRGAPSCLSDAAVRLGLAGVIGAGPA